MEEKKKFSAFDIVNICILGIGVIFTVITLLSPAQATNDAIVPVALVVSDIAKVIALISGIIYMIMRYTKKAALFYKIYMFAFVIVYAIMALIAMTVGSGSMLNSILIIIALLFSFILATAKDFGSVKTFIIAGVMLVIHIVLCFIGFGGMIQIIPLLANTILTAEACIMVLAKYQDKASRGAK